MEAEPQPQSLPGSMAEFGGAEVQRWLGTVDGLTAEQLERVRTKLAVEEFDVRELVELNSPKTFPAAAARDRRGGHGAAAARRQGRLPRRGCAFAGVPELLGALRGGAQESGGAADVLRLVTIR
jgi:hypothetical protein